jgi:1-acyl-sn-glycerol-3-phosphate acyltransferase
MLRAAHPMSIDTFREQHKRAFVGYSPEIAGRFYRVIGKLARIANAEVIGLEHLPPGGALIVCNHTFGWDSVFPMAAVWRQLQRRVWVLGEHVWWRFPFLRRLAAAIGTVDGVPENADRLLQQGELVLVLPGGVREAVKPRELRYRLLWGNRYGFVRIAVRNQVPVVPLAAIGADDLFDFVGNAYRRGERWLRRTGIPIPLPSVILPIPHRVRLRFVFGEPIAPPPAGVEQDAGALRRYRREIEGALHELIEGELARRAGVELEPPVGRRVRGG